VQAKKSEGPGIKPTTTLKLPEGANASLVRPCQRPDRQNDPETTTQFLWRAGMLKLRRAGMVSTKRLLAILLLSEQLQISCSHNYWYISYKIS